MLCFSAGGMHARTVTHALPSSRLRLTPLACFDLPQGVHAYTLDKLCSNVAAVIAAAGHTKCHLVRGETGKPACSDELASSAEPALFSERRQASYIHCRWATAGVARWLGILRCCIPLRWNGWQCCAAPIPLPSTTHNALTACKSTSE